MSYRGGYRRNYGGRGNGGYRPYRKRGPKPTVAKKMVEGTGSTMIEKLAWGVGSAAKVAQAVLPYIKANNAEAKYFDNVVSNTPLVATPTIQLISNIGQGVGETQRVGSSVKFSDLTIRYHITPNYTAQAFNNLRVMIMVDKMGDGVAPAASEIFQTGSQFLSPLNKNFTDRFVLLKEMFIDLYQNGSSENQAGKVYIKLDYHGRYLGTGSTASDQGPGQLYIVTIAQQAANAPTCTYYSRLNFYDN